MKHFFMYCIWLFSVSLTFAQNKTFTISGYIEDAASSEKLIGAALIDAKSQAGVVTNTYGFFSLTLPRGEVSLIATYVGYNQKELKINLRRDTMLTIQLTEGVEIKAVEVNAKRQDRIESRVQMSQVTVPIEQLKKIPALLGEVDVLKALQLLPGVQAGNEGQSGIYVRGGSPDQNLILLDGVPVYNVSHIGGFLSVFNGDAIKNVTLTKGGFPARYGGRLSSVIEIDTKEGNMKEFHGEGAIGLITSRLTLEGPIVKDKVSFMVSGRRTYFDLILNPIMKASLSAEGLINNIDLDLYFYDLNAKVNWKINDKHRLFLSAYNGLDIFGIDLSERTNANTTDYFRTQASINWGNITTAFRWNYLINKKLFANTTLTYSRFRFNTLAGFEEQIAAQNNAVSARYFSGIYDWAGKVDFDYLPNPNHRVRFGASATYHTYNPGALQTKVSFSQFNIDTTLGSGDINSWESYVYAEDELQWGALKANVGVHFNLFAVQGEKFFSAQPRLGLNYLLTNNLALKASFVTMQQNINLLTNEGLGLPTDLWVPSTKRIRPQTSWQAALGVAKTIKDDYEVSLEGYYKEMNNVISYKEGVSFLGTQNNWEDKITQGKGWSYGAELLVQKKEGRTTGWIGYTLAWNNRQFEDINAGLTFPFKYDRRHNISVVVSHKFSESFSANFSWVYSTGNATTLYTNVISMPRFNQSQQETYKEIYELATVGERNSYRMRDFHRLDFNLEWTKKKKYFTRKWSVGAYNAYNRANPFAMFRSDKFVNGAYQPTYRQVAIFPIIPFISYGFKF